MKDGRALNLMNSLPPLPLTTPFRIAFDRSQDRLGHDWETLVGKKKTHTLTPNLASVQPVENVPRERFCAQSPS